MPHRITYEVGTLTVDGWAVAFGTARRGLGGVAVPNVAAHPSTVSVPNTVLCCGFNVRIKWL